MVGVREVNPRVVVEVIFSWGLCRQWYIDYNFDGLNDATYR